MLRGTLTGVVVAIGLPLLAPGVAGAALWTAPKRIGPRGYLVAAVQFARSGAGQLTLRPESSGTRALAAAALPNDRFAPPRPFAPSHQALGDSEAARLFGRDGVVAAGQLTRPGSGTGAAWVAFGRIGRQLDQRQLLAIPRRQGGSVALDADAKGGVAVIAIGAPASSRCGPCGSALYLAVRRAAGRLARPRLVTRSAIDRDDFEIGLAPAVAINARGDALVVWEQTGALLARVQRDGRWLSGAQTLGPVPDLVGAISARLGARDRAVVTWWTQAGDWGGAGNGASAPPVYRLAVAPAGGTFEAAQIVEQDVAVPPLPSLSPSTGAIVSAMDAAGRVTVAWTGAQDGKQLVRAASISADRPGPVQTLGSGYLDDLAVGSHGQLLALWHTDTQIRASLAPPGGIFAPGGEPIAAATRVGTVSSARAAFDPRTGRAVAAWVRFGTHLGQVEYAIRRRVPLSPAYAPAARVAALHALPRNPGRIRGAELNAASG